MAPTNITCPCCQKKHLNVLKSKRVAYCTAICPICLEEKSPLVLLPCGHVICFDDFGTMTGRRNESVAYGNDASISSMSPVAQQNLAAASSVPRESTAYDFTTPARSQNRVRTMNIVDSIELMRNVNTRGVAFDVPLVRSFTEQVESFAQRAAAFAQEQAASPQPGASSYHFAVYTNNASTLPTHSDRITAMNIAGSSESTRCSDAMSEFSGSCNCDATPECTNIGRGCSSTSTTPSLISQFTVFDQTVTPSPLRAGRNVRISGAHTRSSVSTNSSDHGNDAMTDAAPVRRSTRSRTARRPVNVDSW